MRLSFVRCLVVWLLVTAAAVVVARGAASDLSPAAFGSSDGSFDELLTSLAALALLGCAAWGWVVTTAVIAGEVRRRGPRSTAPAAVRGVPPWARRLVLAACGAALVGGVQAAPAHATPGPIAIADGDARDNRDPGVGTGVAAVAGLPLPDRTTGPLRSGRAGPVGPAVGRAAGVARTAEHADAHPSRGGHDGATTITVQPGDSLWSIAERLLERRGTTGEVAALVSRLYATNRAAIGGDPDLIQPGHQLRTPLGERPAR